MTFLGKLVARETDGQYINYVFKVLEDNLEGVKGNHIMCTQFPNWDQAHIELGAIGYVQIFEITAGVTTWFNGTKLVPYRYNNIQFIKFIKQPKVSVNKFTN